MKFAIMPTLGVLHAKFGRAFFYCLVKMRFWVIGK